MTYLLITSTITHVNVRTLNISIVTISKNKTLNLLFSKYTVYFIHHVSFFLEKYVKTLKNFFHD